MLTTVDAQSVLENLLPTGSQSAVGHESVVGNEEDFVLFVLRILKVPVLRTLTPNYYQAVVQNFQPFQTHWSNGQPISNQLQVELTKMHENNKLYGYKVKKIMQR